ncbi:MAG: PBP1A family penicillin-binding protein [Clostridia bacterium]|nr:PBP1A family penicillin-binding protein [Clostridia bacterium]
MNRNQSGKQTSSAPAKKDTLKKVAKTSAAVAGGSTKVAWKIVSVFLNVFLTFLLICIVTGAIMAGAFAMYIKSYIDPTFDIDDLKLNSNLTTSIYYRETDEKTGEQEWVEMEEDRLSGTENRIWVSFDEIPEDMTNAIISIEDKRFYSHKGVDIRRTTGAVLGFITGNDSYGGSTITQQLIKQVTGEDDVTLQRKIQEMMRALDLETKREKSEILEMYLNTIYLSQGCYGVQTAANSYFGKDISECSLVECAALAAIPQAPTKWDPRQNPENNTKRRNDIINEMYELNMITIEERDEAWNTELVLADNAEEDRTSKVHSYYVDTVIDDVVEDLQEELGVSKTVANQMVFSGGLKIYIAQDVEVQKIVDECYKDDSIFPSVTSGVLPESAMTIIDHTTGDIVAIAGGRGEKTTPRGFNRATHAKRQPGSTIKPLSAYSLAIEQGLLSYATPVDDSPINVGDRTWPSNYPNVYNGLVPANQAVYQSKNTCAVRVVDQLTSRYVYDYVTQNYGISTLVDGVESASGAVFSDVDLAPLALGGMTYGVTVRDMTGAYATFANNGVYNEPRTYLKVLDSEGNIILSKDNNSTVLLKESTACIMTKMLQDVVKVGTANRASVTLDNYVPMAAKTGTTTETKDLYFVGYTPYYTAAVWCGYDQPKTLRFSTEASMSVWNVVMTRVHQKFIDSAEKGEEEIRQFATSSRLVEVEICRDSGLLPCSYCSLDLRGERTIKCYFDRDHVPKTTCDRHIPVRFCTESGCVAGEGCPDKNIKIVSLVKIERQFVKQVLIEDAQYTYVDVPDGYVYPADRTQPFYINTYPVGMYAGHSGTQTPANGYCSKHNHGLTDAVLPWSRPAAEKGDKK